jgi:hypothetical protein
MRFDAGQGGMRGILLLGPDAAQAYVAVTETLQAS